MKISIPPLVVRFTRAGHGGETGEHPVYVLHCFPAESFDVQRDRASGNVGTNDRLRRLY